MTSITSIFSKGISLLTVLISVPLTLGYLGEERYGLWMTASSIIIVLGFADLGLGSGLLNAIAKADGQDDRLAAQESVSSTFYILVVIALALVLLFAGIYPFIPWGKFFNVGTAQAIHEAGPAMAALMLLFLVGMPFSIVQRVQSGFQEGYVNDLYLIGGNLLGLLGVLASIRLELSLPWLIVCFIGSPVVFTVINFAVLFYRKRPWLRPKQDRINIVTAKSIIANGSALLILTLLTLVGFQTDNLFIAHFHGASAVTNYSIVQKLSTVAMIYWAFITALWPAYGEAFARNDRKWIKRTVVRSLKLSIAGGLLIGGGLFILGNHLLKWWLNNPVVVDDALLFGFAVFILVNGLIGVVAVVYNSSSLIRKQIGPFIFATAFSLLLKYLIAKHSNADYIIWSTIIGFGCFYLLPCGWLLTKNLKLNP